MTNKLIKTLKKDLHFQKNDTIILAVSGGVDSMVLLDVMVHLLSPSQIIVAHVNHKKRLASDEEYKRIKEIAHRYKCIFEGYIYHHKSKNNFQAEARKARYNFFYGLAQKHHASYILTAHHLDDQIETIFMRMTRGSSFSGYSGMKREIKRRNFKILRPLLNTPKQSLYDYAKTQNLTFFEDASNEEDTYTRNRFRKQIIPLLKEENPTFYDKMIQFSQYMEDADNFIEEAANIFMKTYYMYASIPIDPFLKLERMVQYKVLEKVINKATNDSVEVTYKQYQTLLSMVNSDHPNQFYSLGKSYEWVKEYQIFYVTKIDKHSKVEIEITKAGEYFISDNHSFIFSHQKLEHNHRNYYELCYNEKVFPLYLRNRKNGDRIKLKEGTKKVKDVLIDQKIPRSKRDKLVLVADDQIVHWIAGIKKGYQEKHTNKLYIYEVDEC